MIWLTALVVHVTLPLWFTAMTVSFLSDWHCWRLLCSSVFKVIPLTRLWWTESRSQRRWNAVMCSLEEPQWRRLVLSPPRPPYRPTCRPSSHPTCRQKVSHTCTWGSAEELRACRSAVLYEYLRSNYMHVFNPPSVYIIAENNNKYLLYNDILFKGRIS